MTEGSRFRSARCSRCGDETESLFNPLRPFDLGTCRIRTPYGVACGGVIKIASPTKLKAPRVAAKPIPASEADRQAIESGMLGYERFHVDHGFDAKGP